MRIGRMMALLAVSAGVALIAANISVTEGAFSLRSVWALMAGVFLVGVSLPGLFHRRNPVMAAQDRILADMWAAVRDLPDNWQATDPATGEILRVQRTRTMFTLIVRDPPSNDPIVERAATMTYFLLGLFGRRRPAPLMRVLEPVQDLPEPVSGRQRRRENALAWRTGTAVASLEELVALRAQVLRTVGHAPQSGE